MIFELLTWSSLLVFKVIVTPVTPAVLSSNLYISIWIMYLYKYIAHKQITKQNIEMFVQAFIHWIVQSRLHGMDTVYFLWDWYNTIPERNPQITSIPNKNVHVIVIALHCFLIWFGYCQFSMGPRALRRIHHACSHGYRRNARIVKSRWRNLERFR